MTLPGIIEEAAITPAVQITRLTKTFGRRPRTDGAALDIPALTILPGEMVGLIGASGSGKSTLLRHVAGLTLADRAAAGDAEILVHGCPVQRAGRLAPEIRRVRSGIGFVFQQFNLVSRLPVLTNVLAGALSRLPLWRTLPGWFPAREQAAARAALERVGISDLAAQRASTLSGGQQQRAAIARTLVQGARLILADEPIASLDPESSRRVMQTLLDLNTQDGTTVMVSLHQVEIATAFCRRIVALRAGRVVFDGPARALTPALLAEIYGSASAVSAPIPADRPLELV